MPHASDVSLLPAGSSVGSKEILHLAHQDNRQLSPVQMFFSHRMVALRKKAIPRANAKIGKSVFQHFSTIRWSIYAQEAVSFPSEHWQKHRQVGNMSITRLRRQARIVATSTELGICNGRASTPLNHCTPRHILRRRIRKAMAG